MPRSHRIESVEVGYASGVFPRDTFVQFKTTGSARRRLPRGDRRRRTQKRRASLFQSRRGRTDACPALRLRFSQRQTALRRGAPVLRAQTRHGARRTVFDHPPKGRALGLSRPRRERIRRLYRGSQRLKRGDGHRVLPCERSFRRERKSHLPHRRRFSFQRAGAGSALFVGIQAQKFYRDFER